MGCRGCGKTRREAKEARRNLDHAALEALRQERPGSLWVFDGEVLRRVAPGESADLERYGDPADAIRYWANEVRVGRR